jgi:hypothetical protein
MLPQSGTQSTVPLGNKEKEKASLPEYLEGFFKIHDEKGTNY